MPKAPGCEIPRLEILRLEAHCHCVFARPRQIETVLSRPIAQQPVGRLNETSGAIAHQWIGTDRAPVVEVEKNLQGIADEAVRFAAFDIDHKSDAARVVLIPRVVKTLFLRKTH